MIEEEEVRDQRFYHCLAFAQIVIKNNEEFPLRYSLDSI